MRIEMTLQHAEPDEAMLIKFLLASGFRDREVRYVVWRDIDFHQGLPACVKAGGQRRCTRLRMRL